MDEILTTQILTSRKTRIKTISAMCIFVKRGLTQILTSRKTRIKTSYICFKRISSQGSDSNIQKNKD